LFWLLGYQFSPRLADAGDARLWRIDPKADYGALNGVARHRLNTTLITQHWDDLLRVAGSLKMGTVGAVELMRSLQGGSHQSALARAIGELGRIPKTLHLLAVYDDEAYRRRMVTQLNRGESQHSLARAVFHGRKGELRQHYCEGQEDQLGALGLVVNMLVLWSTRYMDVALAQDTSPQLAGSPALSMMRAGLPSGIGGTRSLQAGLRGVRWRWKLDLTVSEEPVPRAYCGPRCVVAPMHRECGRAPML